MSATPLSRAIQLIKSGQRAEAQKPSDHRPSIQPASGEAAPRRGRGLGLWPIFILLAILAACLLAIWVTYLPKPNRNALAIGQRAKVSALDIPIQPPVELDFKSKAEVLALRSEAVLRYPDLLSGDYEPSEAVFGQIEDGLPWWGITGHFYPPPMPIPNFCTGAAVAAIPAGATT